MPRMCSSVFSRAAGSPKVSDSIARTVKKLYPKVPLYALGESMGGAVVMSALAQAHPPLVDGAILASPAVSLSRQPEMIGECSAAGA